jgi:hypothetical protein
MLAPVPVRASNVKFVLFVEGHTEYKSVPGFLKRWLDQRLSQPVGIKAVCFEGCAQLLKDAPNRARLHLSSGDVICVIALLDLYRLRCPDDKCTVEDRCNWARKDLESRANQPGKLLLFFAVQEIEAWLLSEPTLFPARINKSLSSYSQVQRPETVNDTHPPSKLLRDLYWKHERTGYKKVVHGKDLFGKLDPAKAYERCPHLKELLDEMLSLAKSAGY